MWRREGHLEGGEEQEGKAAQLADLHNVPPLVAHQPVGIAISGPAGSSAAAAPAVAMRRQNEIQREHQHERRSVMLQSEVLACEVERIAAQQQQQPLCVSRECTHDQDDEKSP